MNNIEFLLISTSKMERIRLLKLTAAVCFPILFTVPNTYAENNKDSTTLVQLPDDIKQKTVIIMRDHISALEDIIHAIQSDDYNKAEHIVESRLSWSSPALIGEHKIIKHWPQPMQHMANQLYYAASNYVIISQNAAVKDSKQSEEEVLAALGQVITVCRSCHETYRIR